MFKRVTEDFQCAYCGEQVIGNGYTNHCPECLWSMHVDIEPGDRASECKALMRPVSFEEKKGTYTILHRCTGCSLEKHNKLQENDVFDPEQVLHS
ncbi:MAG: RNHCP domain-containing protein [Candidatus Paceibacterota bacterium]